MKFDDIRIYVPLALGSSDNWREGSCEEVIPVVKFKWTDALGGENTAIITINPFIFLGYPEDHIAAQAELFLKLATEAYRQHDLDPLAGEVLVK